MILFWKWLKHFFLYKILWRKNPNHKMFPNCWFLTVSGVNIPALIFLYRKIHCVSYCQYFSQNQNVCQMKILRREHLLNQTMIEQNKLTLTNKPERRQVLDLEYFIQGGEETMQKWSNSTTLSFNTCELEDVLSFLFECICVFILFGSVKKH